MSTDVVIYSAEAVLAQEVVETLRRLGHTVAAAVVTGEPQWDMGGLANIVDIHAVGPALVEMPVIVPVWGPLLRRKAVEEAKRAGFSNFITLVDPTAVIAETAQLGKGIYVQSSSNIGAGARIGDFAMINRGVMLAHHCVLDPYVSVAGGVTMASRCHIGEAAVVGVGASLIPQQNVGARAIVGGGTVVIRDIEADTTVVGNPARKVKDVGVTPPA